MPSTDVDDGPAPGVGGSLSSFVAFKVAGLTISLLVMAAAVAIAVLGLRSGSRWIALALIVPLCVDLYVVLLGVFRVPVPTGDGVPTGEAGGLSHVRRGDVVVFAIFRLIRALVGLLAAYVVAHQGFTSDSPGVQVVGILPMTGYVLMLVALSTVVRLVPFGGILGFAGDHRTARAFRDMTSELLHVLPLYVLGVTGLFGAWSALWLQHGWLETPGAIPRSEALAASVRFYAWHALNAVPALQLAENLQLSAGADFSDRTGGVLLIVYLIVVVVPVIALVALLAAELAAAHGRRRADRLSRGPADREWSPSSATLADDGNDRTPTRPPAGDGRLVCRRPPRRLRRRERRDREHLGRDRLGGCRRRAAVHRPDPRRRHARRLLPRRPDDAAVVLGAHLNHLQRRSRFGRTGRPAVGRQGRHLWRRVGG